MELDQELREQIEAARLRGRDENRPDAVAAVHAAGRLTARQRLARLLDADSLVEYGALAGQTTSPDDDRYAGQLMHSDPVCAVWGSKRR